MNLVCRERDHVGTLAQLDPAERLDRVGKHERACLLCHFRDCRELLPDADLVIDHHHRDQEHAIVELAREQVEIEAAILIDRKDGEIDTPLGKPFARVEDRGMFGGDRDDPVAPLPRFLDRTLQCPVERFRRAAGEGTTLSGPWPFQPACARSRSRLQLHAPNERRMGVGELSSIHGSIAWATSGAIESSPDSRGRSCRSPARARPDVAPSLQEAVDIRIARGGTEAHANKGFGNFLRHMHRSQDVAFFHLA